MHMNHVDILNYSMEPINYHFEFNSLIFYYFAADSNKKPYYYIVYVTTYNGDVWICTYIVI